MRVYHIAVLRQLQLLKIVVETFLCRMISTETYDRKMSIEANVRLNSHTIITDVIIYL